MKPVIVEPHGYKKYIVLKNKKRTDYEGQNIFKERDSEHNR